LTANGKHGKIKKMNHDKGDEEMDIEKLKMRKKELGMTNQALAERSGVPLGTVNKIFSGATKSPQYRTIAALEVALGMYSYGDQEDSYIGMVRESGGSYHVQETAAAEDSSAPSDHARAELIDGEIFYMDPPSRAHQEALGELYYCIKDYIKKKQSSCRVYLPPFEVRLDQDEKTIVQPDIVVVGSLELLTEQGMSGAPDMIIEILSPGSRKKDQFLKSAKYAAVGVREYWMVDLKKERILVYTFQCEDSEIAIYGFEDQVPVGIFEDLTIDFAALRLETEER